MGTKQKVYVCTSHRPRQFGGGCCSDKGGEKIAQHLKDALKQQGISKKVEVIQVNCLKNCLKGVSVQVMPDQILYGGIRLTDVPKLVDQHLLQGNPLKEFVIEPAPLSEPS